MEKWWYKYIRRGMDQLFFLYTHTAMSRLSHLSNEETRFVWEPNQNRWSRQRDKRDRRVVTSPGSDGGGTRRRFVWAGRPLPQQFLFKVNSLLWWADSFGVFASVQMLVLALASWLCPSKFCLFHSACGQKVLFVNLISLCKLVALE